MVKGRASSLRNLSAALGTEIVGLDEDTLASDAAGAFLHRALLEHQLLLVRGLELDAESFRRIGSRLGPLRRVPEGMQKEPGMSDVQRLSNVGADGAPTGRNPDRYSLHWHVDGSAAPNPARYTLLYALSVPARGADTSFASMYAACDALPAQRRRALSGRVAIHDVELARRFRHGDPLAPAGSSLRHCLRMRVRLARRMLSPRTVRHPVIRVHEETGRPCLYLGDHAWRVTGCWWPEGMRLVDELNAFATGRAEWTYTHAWRPGDLLVWDNRCLLHRGSSYDTAREKRVMLRAVVEGASSPAATHG